MTAHATLGLRAVRTAEIALRALERITELLDEDCDETRVALYNPKATVSAIRDELEQATAALTAAEREPEPETELEIADSALRHAPPYVVNVCECILCRGRQAHPSERSGEGPPVFLPEPTLRELGRRVLVLEQLLELAGLKASA